MVSVKTLAVLALGATANPVRRELTGDYFNYLENVNGGFSGLNTVLGAWAGDKVTTILPPFEDFYERTHYDYGNGTAKASSGGKLSAADGQAFINYVNNNLGPTVVSFANTVKNKASNLHQQGLNFTVRDYIQQLANDGNTFGNQVRLNLVASQTASAQSAFQTISNDLQVAVKAVS